MDAQFTKKVFTSPVHFLAFGFGSGLSPKAPGTVGTVVAVFLYLLLSQLPLLAYLGMVLITFSLGIYICDRSSKLLGVHDHGGIVWDEFVGYWITMLLAPNGWEWIVIGFILFRLFDILKPFPINYFDKHVQGGLGIMIDDVIAGGFAWVCLQLIAFGVAV
ncbi:MAG: phosphatidylglycerophosphatase A [Gammaproteobacteria bacterium]|jgi:phosphatidylglycerophosphatase A|nr:phosphatidylglycerophosphatase A [Gammaproteobacteria bacterium]